MESGGVTLNLSLTSESGGENGGKWGQIGGALLIFLNRLFYKED